MDSFDVIISPKALSQLNDYIDYLQYTQLNDQAAYNVWQDALETRDQLSKVAVIVLNSSKPDVPYIMISSDWINFPSPVFIS